MKLLIAVLAIVCVGANMDTKGLTSVFVEELRKELHDQMMDHKNRVGQGDEMVNFEGLAHNLRSGLFNVNGKLKDYKPDFMEKQAKKSTRNRPMKKLTQRQATKAAMKKMAKKESLDRCKLAKRFKIFKKDHESPGLDKLLDACKRRQKDKVSKLYLAWFAKLPSKRTRRTCRSGTARKRDYQFKKHKFSGKNKLSWKKLIAMGAANICKEKTKDKQMKKLCAKRRVGLLQRHKTVKHHTRVLNHHSKNVQKEFKKLEKDLEKKVAQKGVKTHASNTLASVACKQFSKLDRAARKKLKAEEKQGKSKLGLRGYKYLRCACSKTKKKGCSEQEAKFMTTLQNGMAKATRRTIKKDLKKYYKKQCRAKSLGRKGQHGLLQTGTRKSKVGFEIKPDGTREISIPISAILSCSISWNPNFSSAEISAGCTLFEVITATITVKPRESTVEVEVALCAPGVGDIISLLDRVPGINEWLNNNGIYGGCYRLGHGAYNWSHQNLFIRQDSLCLSLLVFRGCVPSGIYFRFKTSDVYNYDGTFMAKDVASGRCDYAWTFPFPTISNCKPWVNFWINVKFDMYELWLFGSGWRTLADKDILNKFIAI